MELGSELDLSIDRLAAGGEGVSRAPDGRVVFVPWTAPGDRVRARVVECRRSYARAVVLDLLEPGAARDEPVCAVFGSCGGCAWQHVDYRAQLEAKAGILRDALERLGRLSVPVSFEAHGSPTPYGYRSRARLLVAGGRVGYRRRKSRSVCATSHCPILVAPLQEALATFAAGPAPPDGEWELFAGDDGRVRAAPLTSRDEVPGAAREDDPAPMLYARPGKDVLRVSAGVFCQANALLREPLAQAVLLAAGRGLRALELFAGAGFLTLGLARRFSQVVAVESHRPALRDLRFNLKTVGAGRVHVAAQTVEQSRR